jgi:creatinine amidohydrolase
VDGTGRASYELRGTITLRAETYLALLEDICGSLARHGIRRIFILNGHGGNITALNLAMGHLASRVPASVATGTYFQMAQEAFTKILDRQSGVQHACEAETSMCLAIRPVLVGQNLMPPHPLLNSVLMAPVCSDRTGPYMDIDPWE